MFLSRGPGDLFWEAEKLAQEKMETSCTPTHTQIIYTRSPQTDDSCGLVIEELITQREDASHLAVGLLDYRSGKPTNTVLVELRHPTRKKEGIYGVVDFTPFNEEI